MRLAARFLLEFQENDAAGAAWRHMKKPGRLENILKPKDGKRLARPVTDPDVCARCAALGPTCCELTPGEEELCFPVSNMEKHRIDEFLGHEMGGFAQEKNVRAFVNNMARLFPREREILEKLFPSHGFHLRLSTDKSGKCVFLGPAGCGLPNEVRPYYCRLFPFWATGGKLTIFTPGGCLACREGRTARGALEIFDVTAVRMLDLHCRLRMAWGLPPKEGMQNVTPSLAGPIK